MILENETYSPKIHEWIEKYTKSGDLSLVTGYFTVVAQLCVARSTLVRSGELTRDDAIRQIATALGFNRTGPRIRETLESTLRVAVRRGILQSTLASGLTIATRSIDDYTRDDLGECRVR